MQSLKYWQRFESNGLPIYVHPRKPDWFVAGNKADILLRRAMAADFASAGHEPVTLGEEDVIDRAQIFSHLANSEAAAYCGRENFLKLSSLKECWFHLTNKCNLSCRHCLFSASPARSRSLSREQLEKAVAEAKSLGCTLFYFTGGEPFVYPQFSEIIRNLLKDRQVHAVVLTNGLLLEENIALLRGAPADRLHLQISLDGMEKSHEALRGKGTFSRLLANLAALRRTRLTATLSVAVNRENIHDLRAMIHFAADNGIRNMHLLWHFVRGKGSDEQFVPPEEIWSHLSHCLEIAEEKEVAIDNVEAIKGQVFSTPGIRYDLSNSGWESLAVGPDGVIYPSPALVGIEALHSGTLEQGLAEVWRASPVLQELRAATLAGSAYEENALRFLVGGGDIDHSYIAAGEFTGHDPYVPLYNRIALWLIARQAKSYPQADGTAFLLKMGDVRYDCADGGQGVALTHCNCVVSLSGDGGHGTVREFYARAATLANEDIANPFAPQQAEALFIPTVSRQRSYGCGSPVQDAGLKPGETLVDLGSGSGVECFQAAKMVGEAGQVYGIDMTDEMLALARSSQGQVARELGYDNIEFKKGFLEAIPLHDGAADVVISNCVINLSPDKRRTLHEAFRILRPGGRLVVSDIVTDEPIPVHIKNDAKLRGECLGGAMQQVDLMAMLRAAGFTSMKLIKRFPYRQLGATSFYSLTFAAFKPAAREMVDVIYRGPFAAVYTESGELLLKGEKTRVAFIDVQSLDDSVFVVDAKGTVTNIAQSGGCCGVSPETLSSPDLACCPAATEKKRRHADCMVCGSELRYFTNEREKTCYYCGEKKSANASCLCGHFVCDACHQHQGVAAVIKKICTESAIEDMVTLMKKIRSQPAISMHGPEHHALVPGIILSTYRARGGKVGKKDILAAIDRGSKVPGGVCGFWGSCGAAVGAGIAFSVILEATPLTPKKRQMTQQVTAKILGKIAYFQAGRCCQRETMIALQEAADLSGEILPVALLAADTLACRQYAMNRECIRKACILWEQRDKSAATVQSLAVVI